MKKNKKANEAEFYLDNKDKTIETFAEKQFAEKHWNTFAHFTGITKEGFSKLSEEEQSKKYTEFAQMSFATKDETTKEQFFTEVRESNKEDFERFEQKQFITSNSNIDIFCSNNSFKLSSSPIETTLLDTFFTILVNSLFIKSPYIINNITSK